MHSALGGPLVDEEGAQHSGPDGRGEGQNEGVVERQQRHSPQVVADGAETEDAAH